MMEPATAQNGMPGAWQGSSHSAGLIHQINTWRPVITPQQLNAAATALGLSRPPPDLAVNLAKLVRGTCFNVLDEAIHGAERNLRSAIKKKLAAIANTPLAAANIFRLPRFGIMGNADIAVSSFLLIRLGDPKPSSNLAGYFDWMERAQNLARELSSQMVICGRSRFRDLVMYSFAAECIDIVEQFSSDLTLPPRHRLVPSKDRLTDFAADPGFLFGFSRDALKMVGDHGLQLIEIVRSNTKQIAPSTCDLASDRLRDYSALSDFSLHRYLDRAIKAPRLDRPLLEIAVGFIEKAAQTNA